MSLLTATRCSCGHAVELLELPIFAHPNRWQASCSMCLDPTEDAGRLAHVVGYGASPEEALWAWQDDHDDAHVDQIRWSVVTLVEDVLAQAAEEFARQQGATLRYARTAIIDRNGRCVSGQVYEPPRARPAYPVSGGVR